MKNGKGSFLVYVIRKTTALYLLQENLQVSNDRLLRVRSEQASHLFNSTQYNHVPENCVSAGDLCLFKTVDDAEKYIIGRVIQFSYLRGKKREREYSSNYCDISKQSHNNIGTFSNWYIAVHPSDTAENVFFKPIMLYTAGYVAMSNYVERIDEHTLKGSDDSLLSFSSPQLVLDKVLPNWLHRLKFDSNE